MQRDLDDWRHGIDLSRIFVIDIDGNQGAATRFPAPAHNGPRRLKTGVVRWIFTNRPQNLLTAPLIYGLGIPLVLLDFCVTAYQAICFPIYGIAKARRSGYLNVFEKFHCDYCAYANGLIAYAAEIAARTEQYFCPIKHARKVLGSHARQARFLAYGAAAGYPAKLEAFRAALAAERTDRKD